MRTSRSGKSSTARIPEGAFVAFRSDWYKKANLDNPDENGQPHYPGWDVEAIKWLVENRSIGAIGHEPADTDPASVTTKEGAYPYPGEQYILAVDRFQIEVMRNLDQCPPVGGIIVLRLPEAARRRRLPRQVLRNRPQRIIAKHTKGRPQWTALFFAKKAKQAIDFVPCFVV